MIKLKYSFSSLLGAVAMFGVFIPWLQKTAAPKHSAHHSFWFNDSIRSIPHPHALISVYSIRGFHDVVVVAFSCCYLVSGMDLIMASMVLLA